MFSENIENICQKLYNRHRGNLMGILSLFYLQNI
ncbi:hypothetical protein BCE_1395 [Bacillus cereus ATCC 10987]|uniref:Uncharacterized protein n=1 Tax=Bacillus cereus (strain ATCC 10987 / NRS 248) TaxID=222523 RepID=Q73BM3_BACC1|nr:hypothetical protein BCE_1395 [Bacillus cereus ATCC 10987]